MDLNPCPKCGGEAELKSDAFPTDWVECTECGAEGHPYWDRVDLAIKVWNAGILKGELTAPDGTHLRKVLYE
jgi:hypothetical protein